MDPQQYEKVREEWMRNKRARFIEYDTPKRDDQVRRVTGREGGRGNKRPKFVPSKDAPSPYDLLNKKIAFGRDSDVRELTDQSAGGTIGGSRRILKHLNFSDDQDDNRMENRTSRTHFRTPSSRRATTTTTTTSVRGTSSSSRNNKRSGGMQRRTREPAHSSSKPMILSEIRELSSHEQVDLLEEMLQDKSMSSVQKYAVKKQLASVKGKLRREEIKLRQQNQM